MRTLIGPENEVVVKSSRYASLTQGERTTLDGQGYTPVEDAEISVLAAVLNGRTLHTPGSSDIIDRFQSLLPNSLVLPVDGDAGIRSSQAGTNFGLQAGSTIGRESPTSIRRHLSWWLGLNTLIPAGTISAAYFVQQARFSSTLLHDQFALRKATNSAILIESAVTYANAAAFCTTATGQQILTVPHDINASPDNSQIPPFVIYGGAAADSSLPGWLEAARDAGGDLAGCLTLAQVSTDETKIARWVNYTRESEYQVHEPDSYDLNDPAYWLPYTPPYILAIMA